MDLLNYFLKVSLCITAILGCINSALHHNQGFRYVERPPWLSERSRDIFYTDTRMILCDTESCAEMMFSVLDKMYPGLFLTAEEFSNTTGLSVLSDDCSLTSVDKSPGINASNSLGDVGVACVTESYGCRLKGRKNLDKGVDGKEYKIVEWPGTRTIGKYQIVEKGRCGGKGICKYRCLTETTIVSLLAFNRDEGRVGFHAFQVPSYCSCRNIGR